MPFVFWLYIAVAACLLSTILVVDADTDEEIQNLRTLGIIYVLWPIAIPALLVTRLLQKVIK